MCSYVLFCMFRVYETRRQELCMFLALKLYIEIQYKLQINII
jgi:hypothetical protein